MPRSIDQQIPTGLWSSMMYAAIERSELMMMRVVKDMKESWAVESQELSLERLEWEKFSKMLEAADRDPEVSRQLNETLSRLIMPLIQQAFTPQQGQGQEPQRGP